MKKPISTAMLIIFCFSFLQAQVQYQHIAADTSNQKIYDVKTTRDSGYVYTGYANILGAAKSSKDLWIIKTDANGNVQWSKSYGGSKEDIGYAIITTAKAYIAVGSSKSFSLGGEPDIYVVKVDFNGNLIWSFTYGNSFFEEGYDIVEVPNNAGTTAYAVTGYKGEGNGIGFDDAFLMKISASGSLIWFRDFRFLFSGTILNSTGYALMLQGNNNLIVTGTVDDVSSTHKDVLLFKSDSNGNLQWNYRYGSSNDEEGFALAPNEMGGQVITGYTAANAAMLQDILLMRTDANGNLVWTKSYGEKGTDIGEDVIMTSNGNHAIGGYSNSFQPNGNQAVLVQTDMTGNLLSTHMYGDAGFDDAYGLVQANDGGFNLGGSATQSFGSIDENGYMIKTDNTGLVNCYDSVYQFSKNTIQFKQDSLTAVIDSLIPVRNPQIIVSNVQGDSLICGKFTGIQPTNTNTNIIDIYPNPASRQVQINLHDLQVEQLELYDNTGRLIMAIPYPAKSTIEINTSQWAAGMYLIKVNLKDDQITRKLLLVKH